MYVGNLEPYQGIDLLLQAFPRVLARVPEARLVIIGGAPEAIARYRARCEVLGVAAAVHWAGPRSVRDLGAYLRQADVLVSPRLKGQNTPMKIYSYLDSGRAVVATRIPTHTQVLDDEIAVLVEPLPDAMADGIAGLLIDPPRRAAIGARARARVQAHYTPAAAQRKLREFYARVQAALTARESSV
jgi:glycosyltransferase involved in cell wall biosynthesis